MCRYSCKRRLDTAALRVQPGSFSCSKDYSLSNHAEDKMNPAQTSLLAEHGSLKYVLLRCVVAALGGLLFGFDTAVINGAIVFLKLQFALTDSQTEIAASS